MKFPLILFCAISMASAFDFYKKRPNCNGGVANIKRLKGNIFTLRTECDIDFLMDPALPDCSKNEGKLISCDHHISKYNRVPKKAINLVLPEGTVKVVQYHPGLQRYHEHNPCPANIAHLKLLERCYEKW